MMNCAVIARVQGILEVREGTKAFTFHSETALESAVIVL